MPRHYLRPLAALMLCVVATLGAQALDASDPCDVYTVKAIHPHGGESLLQRLHASAH